MHLFICEHFTFETLPSNAELDIAFETLIIVHTTDLLAV